MPVRRNRHVQLRLLPALAIVLCALLTGTPAAQTQKLDASSPSKALVLASAYYADISVVSRLEGCADSAHLARVDLLTEAGNPSPTSKPRATVPRRAERAIGLDVADVPRARAPPNEEMT
jgi:hypothetical protein